MSVEIKIWMLKNGVKATEIAEALNITRQAVYNFMVGSSYSDRIRAQFILRGCPEDILPISKRFRGLAA